MMMSNNKRQKLSRLKSKSKHSTLEMSRLAWSRYNEVKDDLESDYFGKYIMIEVDSGDYFIGDTDKEAYLKAKREYPDKIFHLIKVGYKAAHKLKGKQSW